ncbi:MAG TPA: hypothetical protein VN605_04265, partial [Thermoanaerobaculia bacterium]|nr:hypothetical protein [Thermoanaerobaculia bacterium]
EFVKLHFPVPQAILQGIRHMPDPRALIARLGAKTTLFERTGKVVDDLFSDNPEFADAARLLEVVDGRRTLFDLVQTPPLHGAANARVLYALFALQLIAIKQPVKVQLKTKSGKHRAP